MTIFEKRSTVEIEYDAWLVRNNEHYYIRNRQANLFHHRLHGNLQSKDIFQTCNGPFL